VADDLLEPRLLLGKFPDPRKKLRCLREDVLADVGAEEALRTIGQGVPTQRQCDFQADAWVGFSM